MDPARARERRSSPVDRQYDLRNRSIHSGHSHGPQSQPRSQLRPTEPARMVGIWNEQANEKVPWGVPAKRHFMIETLHWASLSSVINQ